MKFTSTGDINAPTEYVFARMSDFEAWERSIRKRNTVATRSPGPIQPGTTWNAQFRLRGAMRNMTVTLVSVDPGRQIRLALADPSLDVDIVLDLLALAPEQSRVVATLDLRPRNLTARLLVQSLRLARTKVQGQLDQRIAQWARNVSDESRVRGTAAAQ
ncbi:SRPBCC family protein [Falsirhodobacter deserti]|uniref:SRPBCC family protein n=1 Tax=Falsirhodobacter deserti TaxID=1365611 RepID=UPI000FE30FDE|nr:SRPBCC family protein [Falsirhodobacter deserti]